MLQLVLHCSFQDKWAPLHLAAHNGHLKVVQHLVEHGADINARNEVGHSFVILDGHEVLGTQLQWELKQSHSAWN